MISQNHELALPCVACHNCLAEVPDAGAISSEGHDYVMYFCGLDCYAAWQNKGGGAQCGDPDEASP